MLNLPIVTENLVEEYTRIVHVRKDDTNACPA
jgi:hypothetical protein